MSVQCGYSISRYGTCTVYMVDTVHVLMSQTRQQIVAAGFFAFFVMLQDRRRSDLRYEVRFSTIIIHIIAVECRIVDLNGAQSFRCLTSTRVSQQH